MKKKIFSLILALVMVLSLLPTTALAVSCTATIKFRVIPVYLDDSMYLGYNVDYNNDWEGTLPCTYTTTHSSNANHQIKIAGFHPDKIRLNIKEGYEWAGWAKYTIDLSTVTIPSFGPYYSFSSDTTNVTGTGTHYIYMIYHPTAAPAPTPPDGGDLEDILGDSVVTVDCINQQTDHDPITYGLLDGSFTVGSVAGDSSSGYFCNVTVSANLYVDEYNKTHSGHSLAPSESGSKTIQLKKDGDSWTPVTDLPITFEVECTTKPTPPEPAITGFTKELVVSAPDDVTIPDGVTSTYPGSDARSPFPPAAK